MQLNIPKKKPRILKKVQPPDQRTFTVAPLRAATDRSLTPMQLRALLVYCSYVNKAGVAWVGLERIGKDLGVSDARASQLIKALTQKGYIRTLHKGFSGVVAHTRQVIYKDDISADEAATISGELAPFQIQQQEKERKAMEAKQAKRKRKSKAKPIEKTDNMVNVDSLRLSENGSEDVQLVDEQMHTLTQLYGAEIIALARSHLGEAATPEALAAEAERLLR